MKEPCLPATNPVSPADCVDNRLCWFCGAEATHKAAGRWRRCRHRNGSMRYSRLSRIDSCNASMSLNRHRTKICYNPWFFLSTKIQLSFGVRQYAIADGCTNDSLERFRFRRYVSENWGTISLTRIGEKPTCSSPRERPPQPANKSIKSCRTIMDYKNKELPGGADRRPNPLRPRGSSLIYCI